MFDPTEDLKKLPKSPGVYIMHGADDEILYVGKAVNLHNRVRSYFRKDVTSTRGPWITQMVDQITRFEYIVTGSELEALVLENNLIKEHSPKYNTLLKDDKTYPYIKVTVQEEYPRILIVRRQGKDKAKYFGPYANSTAVSDVVELLNRYYKLRTCPSLKDRPCLNYHIGRCSAPCKGEDVIKYQSRVGGALEFLGGNHKRLEDEIEARMNEASEQLRYEDAAGLRDLLRSVRALSDRQIITDSPGEDRDVIALARDERDAVVVVFFVRDGKLIGREHYYMTHSGDEDDAAVLSQFVRQFYAGTPFIPREIMTQYDITDSELIASWLGSVKGARVHVSAPKRGDKEKLVELAAQNAALILSQDREKLNREQARTTGAVMEVASWLGLKSSGRIRMEAYDISNTNGFENVASMVVFEDGKPKRSDYRKFRIKSVEGPNDYGCMKEVLSRRFDRLADGTDTDASFSKPPDVILMDGGRGQVNVALEVLSELGLDIPVCGMVKDDTHNTRGLYFHNEEIDIDTGSEGFKLVTRIQDEAHRFAIEYHRSLRSKEQTHSTLDDIPGVGPARRRALMGRFSSIEEIKAADAETLAEIPEIPMNVAAAIVSYFHEKS